jgi:hypothetical protein
MIQPARGVWNAPDTPPYKRKRKDNPNMIQSLETHLYGPCVMDTSSEGHDETCVETKKAALGGFL